MEIVLGVLVALVFLVVGYGIVAYNRLVSLRQTAESAWSDINVQIKRRYDLVPNLVETVRGYAAHEKSTLDEVVRARNAAVGNHGTPAQQAQTEGRLSHALRHLFALAESYPDLKASANFSELQSELSGLEDAIQSARRYYNGAVRELNSAVQQVPSNIVANLFNFREAEYFELGPREQETVANAPKVSF